jgi:predicted DNA-binding transcriptional regulator AlpA
MPRRHLTEPRGLRREDAAAYIGISSTKFDELVRDGRMPQPKCVDRRKLWDRYALDAAFEELPHENDNEWDALLG